MGDVMMSALSEYEKEWAEAWVENLMGLSEREANDVGE